MRIVVSNPDTIGDVVLRQPLFEAMAAAGHELMLILRPANLSLVPYIAPGARTLTLPFEVYRDDLPSHWDQFRDLFDAARDFAPDVLLIAPYRWTLFEEKLAEELPGVPRYGMTGRLYGGDPHAGQSPTSTLQFDAVAQVDENQAEIEKYAALARLLIGDSPLDPQPRLRPDESCLRAAHGVLSEAGFEPGRYWIAAVAGTRHVSLKQWKPQAWGEVLAHASGTFGRRFLFVGTSEERPLIETVRQSMGERIDHTAIFTGDGAGLGELIALSALSGGYAGHDTGPMHIAAATGKPVLAVFGGGTWPRFIPAVEPSCSIMVGVPCAGCGWACAFDRPHCIDDVPIAQVKQAVEELENATITGREIRVIPPGEDLQARMVREAADNVRAQLRQNGEVVRQLHQAHAANEQIRQQQHIDLASLQSAFESRFQAIETGHANEALGLHQQLAEQARLQAEVQKSQSEQMQRTAQQMEAMQLQFTQTVEQLSGRLAFMEAGNKPYREPWKVRLAKWIAGKNYYVPLLGFRSLPKISIVTPVMNGEPWIRQTIESVLGQNYPYLEYIIVDGGSTDGTLKILDEYRDRIDKIISEPDGGMYDAVAKGFDAATGDVFGYLNCDDLYEPGGLLRVGQYFRDHRRAMVVCHEDTVTMDGWRFPNAHQPRVHVYELLNGHTLFQDGIFFRKTAYLRIGGFDRTLKRAGDWELWLRMSRMGWLRRAAGHVSSFRIRKGQISEDRAAYEAERQQAKAKFLTRFGLPGRIRGRVMQVINVVRNASERLLSKRRFFWPRDYCGKPYPPGEAPPLIARKPVSPLTGAAPDRLLFSTRDTRFGDPRISYVYYESSTGMAMAYPPMSQQQLTELYEKHYSQPIKEVIAPDENYHSPYRNYRGGNIVARNISRIPSPWWWFNKITYHDDAASEILQAVGTQFSPADSAVRFLDVGCFEGGLLDQLQKQTKWNLSGLEANGAAVQVARGKGHTIWQATAEDACVILPQDKSFDVIFLGQTLEHLDDPLIALNRMRLLLSPRGIIVVSLPNLDSKQVELFGPTWAHWHMPYHRTLLSRKALRRLAQLAGMRVTRLKTRTHPYWTTMSVQLNRLGLGAVVPHSAYFPNEMAMHGTRLTGWCRLLWDWRGKGDYMIAVLCNR